MVFQCSDGLLRWISSIHGHFSYLGLEITHCALSQELLEE